MELYSFGSKFIALSIATELVKALGSELQCFSILLYGPSNIFCDNKYLVMNVIVPNSMLNKRHSGICYHRVRESQTTGKIQTGWIPGESNLTYLLSKTTIDGNIRHSIVEFIFRNKAAKWNTDKNNNDRIC